MNRESLATEIERKAESQAGLQNMIHEMREHSRIQLIAKADGTERFLWKEDGKELTGEFLRDPEDPRVGNIHDLMVAEWGKEESETLAWLKHSIAERINDYYVVEDADKAIVAYTNTQYLTLGKEDDLGSTKEESGDSMLFIAHIKVDESFQGKGLARELYARTYEEALKQARSGGHRFAGVIGDANAGVEPVLNRMGRKRLYYEDAGGNIREFPYLSPPIEMDEKTGDPLQDPVPAHLMLWAPENRMEFSVDEVLRMVQGLYREYLMRPDDYESAEAYQNAAGYYRTLLEDLKSVCLEAKDEKIFLLSREEREQKKQETAARGKELYEWETEDGEKEQE